MKKIILGCTLLLSGIIGFVGWAIACVCRGNGGYSSVLLYLGDEHGIIASSFIIMTVVGLVMAFWEIKKEK